MPIIRYHDVLSDLRVAYDKDATDRDVLEKTSWKVAERAAFLNHLQIAGCRRLLEIGAGTGQDSAFFMDHGFDVMAIDLSEAMVQRCRVKGIEAHVMDILSLDFAPASFDAVYALNCLLHVPNADLPDVLQGIATILAPGGLFFLGVYGGDGSEGIAEQDSYDPPRFFSWRTDEQIQQFAIQDFEILNFHVIDEDEICFQSLTLRRPSPRSSRLR